jgi:glyoxylase I family protein
MPAFTGVDHVVLTVTDLDASTRFYSEVMGLLPLLDYGAGRLLMDRGTGFTIGLRTHEGAQGGRFTELAIGLDHVGFEVGSREELVEWERRLDEHGVEYTPIDDQPLAHHLNFRDPDGIALELTASTEVYTAAMQALRENEMSDDEIRDYAAQLMGPEIVVGR